MHKDHTTNHLRELRTIAKTVSMVCRIQYMIYSVGSTPNAGAITCTEIVHRDKLRRAVRALYALCVMHVCGAQLAIAR